MKIAYVTDTILDDTVVHGTHINEVCKGFVSLGNPVILFAPFSKKFKTEINYPTVYIKTFPGLASASYQLKLFFKLYKYLKKNKPDIIYCRQSQLLLLPSFVAKLTKTPIFFEVNGNLIEEIRQKNKALIFRIFLNLRIFNLIEKLNVKMASGFIVVAEGIREYFLKTYSIEPAKVITIANGVNTDFFKPLEKGVLRQKLNLDRDSLYIGYIGSIHAWQGLKDVIKAVPLILQKHAEIKFLIVGDGGETRYISNFIKEHNLESSVELRPAIAHSLVPEYINTLDICISYPFKARAGAASPFKVYEYLSCGKPVVVSDIQGIKEEFGDAVVYAKPESPKDLAFKLNQLIEDNHLREEKSLAGVKFIENGHSWNAVTEKILAFCQNVLKSK